MRIRQDVSSTRLRVDLLDDRIVPSVLFVDDDGAQFPKAP